MEERSGQSDVELIASSLRGDGQAFGLLILRYRKVVLGVVYRICGDVALAEDVAQETFIRVWNRLSTFRPDGNFRAWVCRIAANLTIDALRRHKPTVSLAKASGGTWDNGPEAAALRSERAAAVRTGVARLPVHSRAVLVLREYEGLSYQEIADALDVPLGTVKSRLNDARRRLRTELVEYVEG